MILRNWSACGELPLLFSIAWSGSYLGSAGAFLIGSRLCQIDWDGGWPVAFYLSGGPYDGFLCHNQIKYLLAIADSKRDV